MIWSASLGQIILDANSELRLAIHEDRVDVAIIADVEGTTCINRLA